MESEGEKSRWFGGYEILGELGRGGMGIVYKAHEESLDRDVALKILPARMAASAKLVERFQREARAGATLSHPNIVPVYAVGEHKGTHFIAMELVRGKTLEEVLDEEGPMELERALRILKEVGEALREAHRHGIVHRDIKPTNIMIDHRGRARVMDFGLARVSGSGSDLSTDGAKLGTPAFMSPEQCEGKKLDVRSDIYSLGVTLYVMLTKRLPFRGDEALSVMYNITKASFPDVTKVRPDLSRGGVKLLANMVAKNPSQRYESAKSLLADVERLLSDVNCPIGVPGADVGRLMQSRHSGEAETIQPDDSIEVSIDEDLFSSDSSNVDVGESRGSRFPLGALGAIVVLSVCVGFVLVSLDKSREVEKPEGKASEGEPVSVARVPSEPSNLDDSLVAYWSFDEGRGNTANDSVGGNLGALQSATWTKGVSGTGLQFSKGNSSYVIVPPSETFSRLKGVTVTAWVKVYDLTNLYSCFIYKLSDEPETELGGRQFSLWTYKPGPRLYGVLLNMASSLTTRRSSVYTKEDHYDLNEFFHIAGVVDAEKDEMILYLNGKDIGRSEFEGSSIGGSKTPLYLGGAKIWKPAGVQTAEGLTGVLDEVRIYNRALGLSDIQADMRRVDGLALGRGEFTFADAVVEYAPGDGVGPPARDPNTALGMPEYPDGKTSVSLGEHGSLTLQFRNNALTPSGDAGADLWIYEVGGADESVKVQIRQEDGPWIDVGSNTRAFMGVDIDAYVGRGVNPTGLYHYVRLTDIWGRSYVPASGADIDAVAAISSVPVDPRTVVSTPVVINEVERKLNQLVGMKFQDILLFDILRFLGENYDVRIVVDEVGVAAGDPGGVEGRRAASLVVKRIDLNRVKMSVALTRLLSPLRLSFVARENVIWISTPERVRDAVSR